MNELIEQLEFDLHICKKVLKNAEDSEEPDAYRIGVYEATIESIENHINQFKERELRNERRTNGN